MIPGKPNRESRVVLVTIPGAPNRESRVVMVTIPGAPNRESRVVENMALYTILDPQVGEGKH